MITIEEHELDLVLPTGELGVVVMQPFLELNQSEPYRWENGSKVKQIERILATLQIAREADHACDKTHFTIFPEYAIPGLDGVTQIETVLNNDSWKPGTIVIGSVDGLTKDEYSELCAKERTIVHESNSADKVRSDEWVNCSVTWLKSGISQGNNEIHKWIQPKLCPSWPEEDVMSRSMFQGKCIHVLQSSLENGRTFRFMSMICYDWVGSLGDGRGISAILKTLNEQWSPNQDGKPIHMVFVLQNNPKPNHASFLNNTFEYFHALDYQFVIRDKGVVVFANGAGGSRSRPYISHGYTSLVFASNSPYSWDGSPPSYAVNTKQLRNSDALQTCKDALFRENGECAHSFRLLHPLFVEQTPGDRRRPLASVSVYPLDESIVDPRLPGGQVAAIVKWVNDEIDELHDFATPNADVDVFMSSKKEIVTDELRWCDADQLTKMVTISTNGMTDEENDSIDSWKEAQKASLYTIAVSLSLINCFQTVMIKDAPTHAYTTNGKAVMDIFIVAGGTYHSENIKYFRKIYQGRRERECIVISRDKNDTPLTDRAGWVDDPDPNIKYLGFFNLKSCLAASTVDDLKRIIKTCVENE